MGAGAILLVAAVLIWVAGSEPSEPEASPDTTLEEATTTSTTPTEVTTSTSETTTTSTKATTTAQPPTTTTTIDTASLIEAFIGDLGEAITNGDSAFVFSRLHPEIVDGFGQDVCRSWVETQIMALVDYRMAGEVSGPTTGALDTPGGRIVIDERYSVPIAFRFGGQDQQTTADYVIIDGTVYFTGTCE